MAGHCPELFLKITGSDGLIEALESDLCQALLQTGHDFFEDAGAAPGCLFP
jgi:hypothetical protein